MSFLNGEHEESFFMDSSSKIAIKIFSYTKNLL